MFAALARDFRTAPITFVLLAASVVLFFAVELEQTRKKDALARRSYGAVSELFFVNGEDIHGPFDLWDGPWWRWVRIPASAFHHANLLHLFFNVSTLWFLGPLMERRMRRVTYLSFWFFASLIPMLSEFYLQHLPIGLSGVGCAMFGWCLVERWHDPAVAHRVHDGVVRNLWGCLFVCVALTAAGLLNIANLAHFVGVGYGWLNARASRARFGGLMWLGGHLLIPVAIYGVLHPVWIGRYHAFVGRQLAHDKGLTTGVPFFQEAVRRDPALPSAWISLASERVAQADFLAGWELAIKGLEYNRSSDELENLCRAIWGLLPQKERDAAMQVLKKTFLDESDAWSKRLIAAAPPAKGPEVSPLVELLQQEYDSREQQLEEAARKGRTGRKRKAPAIDPDHEGSAVEGRTL